MAELGRINSYDWLKENDIQLFLDSNNYDIRISKNARWIDQKCTADVLTIISDCILQYIQNDINIKFSSIDIWHNDYTSTNVEQLFKKPNLDEEKAKNEYDKFFQQPMELLAYCGILRKEKIKNRNFYFVEKLDLLEFLALREKNSIDFLSSYIKKVLQDSNLYSFFEDFFRLQTKTAYENVKDEFTNFIIQNTPINGKTECWRIFIKVLNPLAYKNNSCGTLRGRISKNKITYDMLMYNRDNFRDLYSEKPKELTRKQYEEKMGYKPNEALFRYQSIKAKKYLRKFNDSFREGKTEVYDERHILDLAVNIHHIFAESEYPSISMYLENLIALTPTQHFSYAHPNGNTQRIDSNFQNICLLAKTDSIRTNIFSSTQVLIYEFSRFLYVLETGLNNEKFSLIEENDFDGVVSLINSNYIN